jgi:DNA-binding PadR family transcriptional regulator
MLMDGAKTVREIANGVRELIPISSSDIRTSLHQYLNYGYVKKARSTSKKRIIFSITNKGREKLEQINISNTQELILDFTSKPFLPFTRIILTNLNGDGDDLVLEKQPITTEVESIIWIPIETKRELDKYDITR